MGELFVDSFRSNYGAPVGSERGSNIGGDGSQATARELDSALNEFIVEGEPEAGPTGELGGAAPTGGAAPAGRVRGKVGGQSGARSLGGDGGDGCADTYDAVDDPLGVDAVGCLSFFVYSPFRFHRFYYL